MAGGGITAAGFTMTSAIMPNESLLADDREMNPDIAGAPLQIELLLAVPKPARPSLLDLQNALAQQHVVVVRIGAGISWQNITSALVAILLHVILVVGAIWLARQAESGQHAGHLGASSRGGGAGVVGGFVIGPGAPRVGGTTLSPKIVDIPSAPKAPPIPIQDLPAPVTPATPNVPSAKSLQEKLTSTDVVGLPSQGTVAAPQVNTKTVTAEPQAKVAQPAASVPPLTITPPANSTHTSAAPAAASHVTGSAEGGAKTIGGGGAGGAGRGGSRLGQGPGVSEDDDDGYDMMKAGSGGGKGSGRDRGASAAERRVQVLEVTPFMAAARQINDKMRARLAGHRVTLNVRVHADGSVGDVKIVTSCGVPEVDQMFADAARKSTFLPSMKSGRAIDDDFQMSQEF